MITPWGRCRTPRLGSLRAVRSSVCAGPPRKAAGTSHSVAPRKSEIPRSTQTDPPRGRVLGGRARVLQRSWWRSLPAAWNYLAMRLPRSLPMASFRHLLIESDAW